MSDLVCSLGESATLSKVWYCGPGEVVPRVARWIPDSKECGWAAIPSLSTSHQVRRDEVRRVKAEDEAEPAKIILGDAERVGAERIEKFCQPTRVRLNQRGKATAQRANSCARYDGI
jgi:hypothetical protein